MSCTRTYDCVCQLPLCNILRVTFTFDLHFHLQICRLWSVRQQNLSISICFLLKNAKVRSQNVFCSFAWVSFHKQLNGKTSDAKKVFCLLFQIKCIELFSCVLHCFILYINLTFLNILFTITSTCCKHIWLGCLTLSCMNYYITKYIFSVFFCTWTREISFQ